MVRSRRCSLSPGQRFCCASAASAFSFLAGGVIGEDGVVEQGLFVLSEAVRECIHEAQPAHEVNLHARGVEDSGGAALAFLGDPLEGDVHEGFVHLPDHFWVYGNLYVERRGFGDGEVVAFQEAGACTVEAIKEQLGKCIGQFGVGASSRRLQEKRPPLR